MSTKSINIIGVVLIVLETLLQSIGVLDLSPTVQKWGVVGLAAIAFILNGIKIHFSAMNVVVWVNVTAFFLYISGGLADLVIDIPIAEEIKTNILKVSGVVYAVLNIISRTYFKL